MQAKRRTERFVTLELNEQESMWLYNELGSKEREPQEHSKLRTELRNALNPPLEAPRPGGRS